MRAEQQVTQNDSTEGNSPLANDKKNTIYTDAPQINTNVCVECGADLPENAKFALIVE